jgi:hypothetical protein
MGAPLLEWVETVIRDLTPEPAPVPADAADAAVAASE